MILTFYDLKKMADRCLVEERKCIDKRDYTMAVKYSSIWFRVIKAMTNPNYFLDNSIKN